MTSRYLHGLYYKVSEKHKMLMNTSSEDKEIFRWPVSSKRQMNAEVEQLWTIISSPGNLEVCHPFCRSNPVEQWPGVGSRDSVYYYSGLVLYRQFTGWIDGVGYDLEIGKSQGSKSTVSWRISPTGYGKSVLSITIQPYNLQHMPLVKRWFRHYTYLRPVLRNYLSSVLLGFDWYITTGKRVKRNQFGPHQWFSPDE